MTQYNVHLYREMRLTFACIEADTPEAAAQIARETPTSDADDVNDCEGENLAALVDLAGADDYSESVTIEFEGSRQRRAARAMLEALERATFLMDRVSQGDHHALENLPSAVAQARIAIANAAAACSGWASDESDIHAQLARRRQIAAVWGIDDVQGIRPNLSDDQAWEVLQTVDRRQDAEYGITWLALEATADELFGDAAKTDANEA